MTYPVEYASFFVRLWRSHHAEEDTSMGEWHGEVEHVQTGMKWEFDNVDELLAFLARQFAHPSTWHPAE